jgi:hypothetical protein
MRLTYRQIILELAYPIPLFAFSIEGRLAMILPQCFAGGRLSWISRSLFVPRVTQRYGSLFIPLEI